MTTTYAFTERAPYEAGFADVFHARIVPILKRHEAARRDYRRKALAAMTGSGALGLGGAGAGLSYESEFGILAGVLGGAGAVGAKAYFEGQWRAGLGDEALPILCDFLGDMTYGGPNLDLAPFSRLGVIPGYDSASLEDSVSGAHDGLDWALTEAHLTTRHTDSRGRTRTTTVFRGLLFKIEIFGPAPRIFFGRDRGAMLNWFSETLSSSRRGLEKIEIPDAAFEQAYETYTDDVDAAWRFIGPELTAGLREIARSEVGKRYVACAMEGDAMFVALPRSGDFLSLGSLFTPLSRVEDDLHEALSDLDLPRRVIDRLRGVAA